MRNIHLTRQYGYTIECFSITPNDIIFPKNIYIDERDIYVEEEACMYIAFAPTHSTLVSPS